MGDKLETRITFRVKAQLVKPLARWRKKRSASDIMNLALSLLFRQEKAKVS